MYSLRDQLDVGGLHHRVGGLDGADQPAGFDEPKCFASHVFRMLRGGLYHIAPRPTTAVSSGVFIRRHAQIAMNPRSLALSVCLAALVAAPACRKKQVDLPPVATPTITFSSTRIPLGSPVEVTYKFQVAPGRDLRRQLHGARPLPRLGRRVDVDRRSSAAGADEHVEAGADDRIQAHDVRADLPLRRAGERAHRPLLAEDVEAAAAGGRVERPARIQGRRPFSCCRTPRTCSCCSRTAGIRPRPPRTTPPSNGSGRRSRRRSPSGIPRSRARSTCTQTIRGRTPSRRS